jgi:transposase-like protein
MRREIRRALRKIELLEQCPTCEIDTDTIGEELYWNGAKRYLKCPDCGYEFQIEFRMTGNTFEVQALSPGDERAIHLDLTDEEREYLRHALGKRKPM